MRSATTAIGAIIVGIPAIGIASSIVFQAVEGLQPLLQLLGM